MKIVIQCFFHRDKNSLLILFIIVHILNAIKIG